MSTKRTLLSSFGQFTIAGLLILSMIFTQSITVLALDSDISEDSERIIADEKQELQDKEEIEELTNEPQTSRFDGYTVKISDGIDKSMKKDINECDDAEAITDRFVSVDNPEDALKFADPEDIEYIEPNYYVSFDEAKSSDEWNISFESGGKPNDPNFGRWEDVVDENTSEPGIDSVIKKQFIYEQWNLEMVNAEAAWKKNYRGQGVKVAVIDSGIYTDLEDINYDFLTGKNFYISSEPYYADWKGHGTRVASIFYSKINNENKIAGITDKVQLMPVKVVSDDSNVVTGENYLEGIEYARKNGVDVINISMGLYYDYAPLEDEINYFAKDGGITVAPVGNHNKTTYRYPASYDHVIAVGGVDGSGERWYDDFSSGSNYNNKVDVVAPAKSVPVLDKSNAGNEVVKTYTGCSYAVPHVTALAAVSKQFSGGKINVAEFKKLLSTTSTDKGEVGKDNYYGYGIINFEKFIDNMKASNTGGNASVDYYNIKYVLNKGKFKNKESTTYTGKSRKYLPTEITRKGYVFAGWYKSSTFTGSKGTFLPVGASGDRVFYAKWTPKASALKFKVNGGKTMKTKQKTIYYEKKVSSLPVPKRNKYNFKGWYTKSGNCYTTSRVCKATSNITVYAKWTKSKVLKFNANKGTVLVYAKEFKKGQALGELPTATRSGYKFKGWYTKKKGGTKITANKSLKKNKNYVVYARWVKI